jgi:hypothetical protein
MSEHRQPSGRSLLLGRKGMMNQGTRQICMMMNADDLAYLTCEKKTVFNKLDGSIFIF